MPSPTQRALKELRSRGLTAEIVERWNSFAKVRHDLFNIVDVLAIGEGTILGVQVTSTSNMAARIKKSLAEPRLRTWLEVGAQYEVWGFSKKGPQDKRKTWQLTVRRILLIDGLLTVEERQ